MANRARRSLQDADSRVPRYLQVASALRRRIRDGRWVLGDKIATLEELEREFDVARVTVRQAIELLQSEGLLKSHQGRGTFVTKAVEHDRWLQLATDWESLIAPIRDHVPQLLPPCRHRHRPQDRGGRRHRRAGLRRSSAASRSATASPTPTPACTSPSTFTRGRPRPFAARVALAVLSEMKGLAIARAHQTVVVGAADLDTAQHLGIGLNAPTAEARCIVADKDGVVIYVGEITYPGDYVRLNIELIPL